MGTINVGDKVRVVACTDGHQFEIGDVVAVTGVCGNSISATDGISVWYLLRDEYEPIAPNHIVVGGEYTSLNGNEWKCIFVDGDYAWLTSQGSDPSAAYVFTTDGTNISQGGGEWNIKFDPVVETVTVAGSIQKTWDSDGFITLHELHGDHKFNMTVDFIDGKPDWSTAKVTDA